jgi:hypothetical protein
VDLLSRIRVWLVTVLALGMCGTIVELLLLGHYEDVAQFVPLVLILLALAFVVWHLRRPSPRTLLMLQIIMTLFLFAGVAGMAFHFQGAAGFQRDIDPSQPQWELFKKVMQAQTPPVLAPGMMIQLGLIGLICTYRHPAVQSTE